MNNVERPDLKNGAPLASIPDVGFLTPKECLAVQQD
jgi:hypothetical protein